MNYQWISEITILQASEVVFFQHLFMVTLCRCPRQPISGLVVPGAFRALGSFRGNPGENSAVSASNFEPQPVGLGSNFIFLLMLHILKMIGLGEQISSRGCYEATDVVGILLLFNLALWILWIPSEGLPKWRELIGDGDFRVMLLQIQTNYDRNMAFIILHRLLSLSIFNSLKHLPGRSPRWAGRAPSQFSQLQITAALRYASLKAWSSFDWSQQLSQLSLRQVGSDFGILWCILVLSSSQFIPVPIGIS